MLETDVQLIRTGLSIFKRLFFSDEALDSILGATVMTGLIFFAVPVYGLIAVTVQISYGYVGLAVFTASLCLLLMTIRRYEHKLDALERGTVNLFSQVWKATANLLRMRFWMISL